MCTFPMPAWRSRTDPKKIVFDSSKGLPSTLMHLPCGQCIACRMKRARDWAHRCVHESTLHDHNCFVTLTYDDANLVHSDAGPTLYHRDFQLFMKRLRKAHSDLTIRYFMCGEYGERFARPHYHLCLFGYDFPDKQVISKTSAGFHLYQSKELSELWTSGMHRIGELNFDTACYCARYVLKKVTGEKANDHYGISRGLDGDVFSRHPEYCAMSRRPGIGRDWYEKYRTDLYNYDHCVTKPTFISKPPKYYDRLLAVDSPDWLESIKADRKKNIQPPDYDELARRGRYDSVKQSKIIRQYEKGLGL